MKLNLTTRRELQRPLTPSEMDGNFELIENAINENTGGGAAISKRVITHSDGGTIDVETFVGKVEVGYGYGYDYGYDYGYGYGYEGSIMIGEW